MDTSYHPFPEPSDPSEATNKPPAATKDLIAQVSQRYIACYEKLTGQTFEPGVYPVEERLRNAKLLG